MLKEGNSGNSQPEAIPGGANESPRPVI